MEVGKCVNEEGKLSIELTNPVSGLVGGSDVKRPSIGMDCCGRVLRTAAVEPSKILHKATKAHSACCPTLFLDATTTTKTDYTRGLFPCT